MMMHKFDRSQHLCLSDGGICGVRALSTTSSGTIATCTKHHQEHHAARCCARPCHRVDCSGVVATECQRHALLPRGASGSGYSVAEFLAQRPPTQCPDRRHVHPGQEPPPRHFAKSDGAALPQRRLDAAEAQLQRAAVLEGSRSLHFYRHVDCRHRCCVLRAAHFSEVSLCWQRRGHWIAFASRIGAPVVVKCVLVVGQQTVVESPNKLPLTLTLWCPWQMPTCRCRFFRRKHMSGQRPCSNAELRLSVCA